MARQTRAARDVAYCMRVRVAREGWSERQKMIVDASVDVRRLVNCGGSALGRSWVALACEMVVRPQSRDLLGAFPAPASHCGFSSFTHSSMKTLDSETRSTLPHSFIDYASRGTLALALPKMHDVSLVSEKPLDIGTACFSWYGGSCCLPGTMS
jgi:hypothetical protein